MQSSHIARSLSIGDHMDYVKKLDRIDNHLREHPHDYQAVIARLKVASDAYDYQLRKRKLYRLKRLQEVRRQLKEIENGNQ